jgi:Ca2+:H+ antiporter
VVATTAGTSGSSHRHGSKGSHHPDRIIAVVSIVLRRPIELGLGQKDQVLLALTLLVGVITLGTGRTAVLQGIIHLVIFAVFLFFAVVP